MRIGDELRRARVGAGLSLRFVGARIGRSPTQVMRIERGLVPEVSVRQLARIGAVLGLDVRTRAYPGGDPVRDVAQVRLIQRLTSRLGPDLVFRAEVPLPIEGDQRAWDGWISNLRESGTGAGRGGLPVDAETRLHDVQALLRRLTLKLRDASEEHVLLVIADTRSNRHAVAASADILATMFPIQPRHALACLARGRHPGGSALVFL